MSLPAEVNLPREHQAEFPSRCVVCGNDPFGNLVKLWTHTQGWWTWIFWVFGSGFSVRVPACGGCAWHLRMERWGRLIATILIAVVVMFLIWPNIDEFVPKPMRKFAAMALVLLCLLPYFLWQAFKPSAVDITAFSDSVNYEFRDPQYAADFAELNSDARWVKITQYD